VVVNFDQHPVITSVAESHGGQESRDGTGKQLVWMLGSNEYGRGRAHRCAPPDPDAAMRLLAESVCCPLDPVEGRSAMAQCGGRGASLPLGVAPTGKRDPPLGLELRRLSGGDISKLVEHYAREMVALAPIAHSSRQYGSCPGRGFARGPGDSRLSACRVRRLRWHPSVDDKLDGSLRQPCRGRSDAYLEGSLDARADGVVDHVPLRGSSAAHRGAALASILRSNAAASDGGHGERKDARHEKTHTH
jgi:hypothetical protein